MGTYHLQTIFSSLQGHPGHTTYHAVGDACTGIRGPVDEVAQRIVYRHAIHFLIWLDDMRVCSDDQIRAMLYHQLGPALLFPILS